jgi:hypothetical protein
MKLLSGGTKKKFKILTNFEAFHCSVADPDPHHFGKLYPDPHQSGKPD